MFSRKYFTAVATAALTALAATAAYADTIEIWTSRDAQQGGVAVVAQEKGFFKDAGADVNVRFVSSGSEIPAGMAGQSINVAIAGWTNPMSMVANGLPVKILARTADTSGAFQIVARKADQVKSVKDLEGKKIGMMRIPLVMPMLTKACAAAGCDFEKLTLVNMQPEDIVLAFQRGNVDAVLIWEPWATYSRQLDGDTVISASDEVTLDGQKKKLEGLYAAVFARSDFIEGHPNETKAILKGLNEAAKWMKANTDEAASIISKKINIPQDVVSSTLGSIETSLQLSSAWSAEYDAKAQALYEAKELKQSTTAEASILSGPLSEVCAECVKQ
ncbi:ABC transporter substrate-binding protein [Neoaquamicrobium sediminum]|uniref:ABC transporter substrate-binding protein n=1 Tax=Neoaquamicrobium sediminum TaxID=1849104 RepID=UPI0015651937|nr:ABC transporter substrate-binding protein [Mesorhizobium sediminum]NRC57335.1 ABC transporter substrate-binding protein [Mesorhizobium sediminum]